ncbi:hypothetical protein ACFYW8_21650 [Streptomyces sp. NPDC002742]|uniref:hypothetical protein n=1 Tax=Streptomyces sp. NPDC002742 TaxID=3364663 RepID=UPI0036A129ED
MTRRGEGRRTSRHSGTAVLAGWLFADLLLMLFLVAMASVPADPSRVKGSPTASPSGTPPTGSPSASPSGSPRPEGLDPDYIKVEIKISPDSVRDHDTSQLRKRLTEELARKNPKGLPVGFVLVFASGPNSLVGQSQAIDTAETVVSDLRDKEPGFARSAGLGYWEAPGGYFDFKIFLLR